MRIQLTRSSPLELLTRHPLVAERVLKSAWRRQLGAVVAVGLLAASLVAQTGTGDERFIRKATIHVSRTVVLPPPGVPLESPVALSSKQVENIRHILLKALRKNRADEADAKRQNQVLGGVPGCVDYSYQVVFQSGGNREVAALHIKSGWLQGGGLVGNIQFTEKQRQELETLLSARSGRCG